MSFEPRDYLRHILVEADYLIAQTVGVSTTRTLGGAHGRAKRRFGDHHGGSRDAIGEHLR
jgi:hypothetical protein